MGEKAVLSRPTMGAKKLSWNDMTSSSPRIHVTRRILQLQNDKSASEILDRAKQFCSEYVNAKLEREGLKTFSITEKYSERPSRVSKRIQEVGVLLEECYPRLYTDISRHINTTLTSESVVNDVFLSVSTEILSEGINWARLVALYAFAGALTVECYEKGKQAFVVDMGNWMYEFAALYMVDWIKRRGGWEDLLRVFPDSEVTRFLPCQRGRWKFVTLLSDSIKLLFRRANDLYQRMCADRETMRGEQCKSKST